MGTIRSIASGCSAATLSALLLVGGGCGKQPCDEADPACGDCMEHEVEIAYLLQGDNRIQVSVPADPPVHYTKIYQRGLSQPPTSLADAREVPTWSLSLEFDAPEPPEPAALLRVRGQGPVELWKHALSPGRFDDDALFGWTPTILPAPDADRAPPVPLDAELGRAYFGGRDPGSVCGVYRGGEDPRAPREIRFYNRPDGDDACDSPAHLFSCYVFESVPHVTVMRRYRRDRLGVPLPVPVPCQDAELILGPPALWRIEIDMELDPDVPGGAHRFEEVASLLDGAEARDILGAGRRADFPRSGEAVLLLLRLDRLRGQIGDVPLGEPRRLVVQQVHEPARAGAGGHAQRATLHYEAEACQPLEPGQRAWARAEVSAIDRMGVGVITRLERRIFDAGDRLLIEEHADVEGDPADAVFRSRRRWIRVYDEGRLHKEFEVIVPESLDNDATWVSRLRTFEYSRGRLVEEHIRDISHCDEGSGVRMWWEPEVELRVDRGAESWPPPACPEP